MVAMPGGRVAGVASATEREHLTGGRDTHIGELVTDHAVEGRGPGRALLAAAERWAASRSLAVVTIETGARSYRAWRFYERVGSRKRESG